MVASDQWLKTEGVFDRILMDCKIVVETNVAAKPLELREPHHCYNYPNGWQVDLKGRNPLLKPTQADRNRFKQVSKQSFETYCESRNSIYMINNPCNVSSYH